GNLKVETARDVIVGALGVRGDLLNDRLFPVVEVDREVRRAVGLPVEVVVDDLVLAEPDVVLGQGNRRGQEKEESREDLFHGWTPSVGEDVSIGLALARDEEIQDLVLERKEVLEESLELVGAASPGLAKVLELVL